METKKSFREALGVGLVVKEEVEEDIKESKINDEDKYTIIDVSKMIYEPIRRLAKNSTYFKAIPYNYHEAKKEKPILIKQKENYKKPLTFELMVVGNYYVVRERAEYYDAPFGDYVMQCVGKDVDSNGVGWITYQLTSNPDDYLECRYIVTKSSSFSNRKFRRLPNSYWRNLDKYNKIKKEYYIDHVELTGIY